MIRIYVIFYWLQNGCATSIKALFFDSGNSILRFLNSKEGTSVNTYSYLS